MLFTHFSFGCTILLNECVCVSPVQEEDFEEEAMFRTGCKEYFWLLCKLIDNIHVKDASQTTLLDLDALARHLADCIRRSITLLLLGLLHRFPSVTYSFRAQPQANRRY